MSEEPNADWITNPGSPATSTAIVWCPQEAPPDPMEATSRVTEECISLLEGLRTDLPEATRLNGLRTSNVGNVRPRLEYILTELWLLRADTGVPLKELRTSQVKKV